MISSLHYETVTPELKQVLLDLMSNSLFESFRLVGGTSLSLRYGHRMSIDIDLFTDAEYGSVDFSLLEQSLQQNYPYYYRVDVTEIVGMGRSYYIGHSEEKSVKLDLFYSDPFIRNADVIDNIRIAHVDDVVAMKMDVLSRGGRKKDFWDIHFLFDYYSVQKMIELHKERSEWTHVPDEINAGLVDFSLADEMPDPNCLLFKNWDIIKIDFVEKVF
jgi:predicted nucleotidyltransferase component of viral defense system